jgi:hypothetical protein
MRPANTAIHLSRLRKVLFLADHTLRPGDGERRRVRLSKYLITCTESISDVPVDLSIFMKYLFNGPLDNKDHCGNFESPIP